MEPSRLQNIFEQILYISLRKGFDEQLLRLANQIRRGTNASSEETIEIVKHFAHAAFQEAICKLTPTQIDDDSESPTNNSPTKATVNAVEEKPKDDKSSANKSKSPEDLLRTIAERMNEINATASELFNTGADAVSRIATDIQIIVDGAPHTINEIAEKIRRRFQTRANPAPTEKSDDSGNPPESKTNQ